MIARIFSRFRDTPDETYAERLGWPHGTRALILHVDDAGMSPDSNRGTQRALSEGAATSCSVMIPCPPAREFIEWTVANPEADAGIHVTLNAEWDAYRWGPVSDAAEVPGLVNGEGMFYPTAPEVVDHATPGEFETEVRAQIERARAMGLEPTHLDAHLDIGFATEAFAERYITIAIDTGIPLMAPAGHRFYANQNFSKRAGALCRKAGRKLWKAGLPVIDDLHTASYDWPAANRSDRYLQAIKDLKPGITTMLMHCTEATKAFAQFSGSGPARQADLDTALDPKFRQALQTENIVLTTWRELRERRER